MLGQRLVTKQTGAAGLPIDQVYVEAGSRDRARAVSEPACSIASAAASPSSPRPPAAWTSRRSPRSTPEKILSVDVHPAAGLQPYQCRAARLRARPHRRADRRSSARSLQALYRLYLERDASLVEINPLIVTSDGELVALDAKINIDANALFRQPELAALRDPSARKIRWSARASEHDLNYVSLDGDIACMVNGAGLAMATMDLIKLHGGAPANFLDVGGGATAERVTAAFKLILSNPQVRAILVNIFGGIVRCDLIAEGIINAVKNVGVQRAGGGAARRHQRRAGARAAGRQRAGDHSRPTDLTDAATQGRRGCGRASRHRALAA